jgi:sugar/nucleoside kinase (ribokinase family)
MHSGTENAVPEYLVIGHVTRDLVEGHYRLGGSALFTSLLASRMGYRTALFTATSEELPLHLLSEVEIINQPTSTTTTFQNQYTPSGRRQILIDRAPDLDLDQLPDSWRQATITHLAPVAREINLDHLPDFNKGKLFLSLQGWLRDWDQDGLVRPQKFPLQRDRYLRISGAFLSIEDLGNNRNSIPGLLELTPTLILTLGKDGSELYQDGTMTRIDAIPSLEVDPTGAGDIYATAFIIYWVMEGKSALRSCQLASVLAGLSVSRSGIMAVPSKEEIKATSKVS